jgi:hypothetical protein
VGGRVLRDFAIGPLAELRDWSETTLEWQMIEVSFLFRLGFLVLNSAVLVLSFRALGQGL